MAKNIGGIKMVYFVVDGGIGKHIMATALIDELVNIYDEVEVVSAYPEIFYNLKGVIDSWSFKDAGKFDTLQPDTVLYSNPYYSDYVFGNKHLLTCWAEALNIEYSGQLPQIILDKEPADIVRNAVNAINSPFIIVQFGGGQSPYNYNKQIKFNDNGQLRSYPLNLAQQFIDEFKQRHPHIEIVNYCMSNEPYSHLQGCINLDLGYLIYAGLLPYSLGFVGIDSSLQHMAANRFNNKKGVVIWGATGPKNLGYECHQNITNTRQHHLRPLTYPFGDVYNADETVWQDSNILSTSVPVDKLLKEVSTMLENNLNKVVDLSIFKES